MTWIDYQNSCWLIFWWLINSSSTNGCSSTKNFIYYKKFSLKIKQPFVQIEIFVLAKYLCFWLYLPVNTAGRGRSWEDQPGVSGWEKRPGCDLLGPEALLRQYLPGAAGCSLWLSVAPSSGPGWDCPDLEHTIALQGRTRLMEMTSAWRRQRGRASWTSVTYTDPVTPGRLFLKCIFFSFPKPRSWKS